MKTKSFYNDAHIIVAAIRICEYLHCLPPSVEKVCETISISVEQGYIICRKLHDLNIIEIVEGAFGTKLFVKDHLEIETISKKTNENNFAKELEKFHDNHKKHLQEIENIQSEQEEKKKNLFSELEKQLKQKLAVKK